MSGASVRHHRGVVETKGSSRCGDGLAGAFATGRVRQTLLGSCDDEALLLWAIVAVVAAVTESMSNEGV